MTRVLAHAHSTWSHDGHIALSAYPDIARASDCAVVLLTEHEETGWDDARYRAYTRACDALSTADVRLVPGLEFLQDGCHVLAFGVYNLPPRPSSAADLAAAIHAQGGVLALAHPAKYRWSIPPAVLAVVDAIEIWNSKWIYDGIAGPHPWSVHLARHTLAIAGQDVHKPKHLSPLVLVTEGEDVLCDLRDGLYGVAWGSHVWSTHGVRNARGGKWALAYRFAIDHVLAAYRAAGRLRDRVDPRQRRAAASSHTRTPSSSPLTPSSAVPMVSVIVPIRNEEAYIWRALESVLLQDYPADRLEILVADGRSTDGTRAIVQGLAAQEPDRIRLIDNPGRIVSTGLNAALAIAAGDVIVRVDGHCEIPDDFVRRAVTHLVCDDVDCVGGLLETIGETRRAATIAVAMSSRFGVGGSAFRSGTQYSTLTDTVAFPAFTRRAIARTGAFDETLVRNQDDEYSYRLRGLGGRILVATDMQARYYSRGTLGGLWHQAFEYGFWKVRVLQKHPRQMRARQFVPAIFVTSVLLAAVLAMWSLAWAPVLFTILGLYLVATIAASVSAAHRGSSIRRGWPSTGASDWGLLASLPIAFATLHVAYGAGSLVGIAAFWRQWLSPIHRHTPRERDA